MAPRANWKGHLRLGALSCAIALYSATTTAERVSFNLLNRATGHRLRRAFLDETSGEPVPRERQVKGFDLGEGRHLLLEQAEIDKAVPEPTKVLAIDAFVPLADMDLAYLDTPYYLAPADATAGAVFALLREAMRHEGMAGLARTVIFRRERLFLLQPYGAGLLGTTLHFDYEIRPAAKAFGAVPAMRIPAEMRALARHIIETRRGRFDPATVADRYEAALVKVIRAKQAGRPITPKAPAAGDGKVVDLLEALRRSAGRAPGRRAAAKRAGAAGGRPAPRRRKAG